MAGLDAGRLDREIVLQTVEISRHPSTGEEIEDWDQHDETVWAEWDPAPTREIFAAQARKAAYIDGVFRIYYRDRPDARRNRIVFDGIVYDIKPPVEIGRRDGWEIPVVAHEGDTA